jgi:hypothetical protein
MSQISVPFRVTVYMNQRDITDWCRRVTWSQPSRYMEREFEITTHAWNLFDDGAVYDIYATYDPTKPRDECVIRRGMIVPSERQMVDVRRDQQPMITIKGKDGGAIAFRKAPKETIVMIPDPQHYGSNMAMAQRLLRKYNKPVGRIKVISNVTSLRRAVYHLCRGAGFRRSWEGPSYPIQPIIIEPGLSYWDAILNLIAPFALEVYYDPFSNRLHFADPISRYYGRRPMRLSGEIVEGVRARPLHRQRVRRVLVKVPAWP